MRVKKNQAVRLGASGRSNPTPESLRSWGKRLRAGRWRGVIGLFRRNFLCRSAPGNVTRQIRWRLIVAIEAERYFGKAPCAPRSCSHHTLWSTAEECQCHPYPACARRRIGLSSRSVSNMVFYAVHASSFPLLGPFQQGYNDAMSGHRKCVAKPV